MLARKRDANLLMTESRSDGSWKLASWIGVEGAAEGLGNVIPDEKHVSFGESE